MKTQFTLLTTLPMAVMLPLLAPSAGLAQANSTPGSGAGRQVISNKLEQIRLDAVTYDSLPLSEVVMNLRDEARRRDPEKKGINFMINPTDPGAAASVDTPGDAAHEAIDVGSIAVRIKPSLTDVRLVDLLDAVVKVAERPIHYSVEDYGVVFSARASQPTRPGEAGFTFPGGTPNDFLGAVQRQYKVDWTSVAEIPKEMADARIPKLRIPPGSFDSASHRTAGENEPLAALVSLYNQLGEQKLELGRLLVKGDLSKPSVVLFVPDKSVAEEQAKIKVKAFSIYGINDAERAKLREDIDMAQSEAVNYAHNLRGFSNVRNLQGTVAIHGDTSLLVATGPESFVEMVESIVNACQAKEHARNPGSPVPGTTGK